MRQTTRPTRVKETASYSRWLNARVLALALVFWGPSACEDATLQRTCPPPATPCADPSCQDLECASGALCPAGTVCRAADGEGADPNARACRVPTSRPPIEQTLIEGFATTVFDLKQDSKSPGTYIWQRVDRAQYVQCALFICPPVVRAERVDGVKELRWIANFHECALSAQSFNLSAMGKDQSELTFSLSGMRPNPEEGACGETKRQTTSASQVPIITTLNVGCWASDSRAVVAASSLLAVDPRELPQFSRPVLSCAALEDTSEGELCVATTQLGTCELGTCVLPEESNMSAGGDQMAPDAGADAGPSIPPSFECAPDGQDNGRPCLRPDALGVCREHVCRQVGERPPATLLVSECGDGKLLTNGLNCFPSVTGMIGTCNDSRCRSRCRSAADCRGLGRDGGDLMCDNGSSQVGTCVETPSTQGN
jgi:hypothetical protein